MIRLQRKLEDEGSRLMKKTLKRRIKSMIFIITGVWACLILPLKTCADDVTVDKAETEIVTTAPIPGSMTAYSENKAVQTYDAAIIASAAALVAFTGQRLSRKKK